MHIDPDLSNLLAATACIPASEAPQRVQPLDELAMLRLARLRRDHQRPVVVGLIRPRPRVRRRVRLRGDLLRRPRQVAVVAAGADVLVGLGLLRAIEAHQLLHPRRELVQPALCVTDCVKPRRTTTPSGTRTTTPSGTRADDGQTRGANLCSGRNQPSWYPISTERRGSSASFAPPACRVEPVNIRAEPLGIVTCSCIPASAGSPES